MFKLITATILFTAFAAQTFYGSVVVLDYFANTSSYAKSCINKARPKLHCNGKCQMMKKLKEAEKKEQQNTEQRSAKTQVLSSRSFFWLLIIPSRSSEKILPHETAACTVKPMLPVFHPPKA